MKTMTLSLLIQILNKMKFLALQELIKSGANSESCIINDAIIRLPIRSNMADSRMEAIN